MISSIALIEALKFFVGVYLVGNILVPFGCLILNGNNIGLRIINIHKDIINIVNLFQFYFDFV